jgi:S1-C subfamily serine protease
VDSNGTLLPGPLAASIVDELIRNNLSPRASFGSRVIDFAPPISARLGSTRSAAGVALVAAKSAAARSGLEAGDVIIAVNDEPVSSASGRQITITIARS